jgi:carboxymethylenebutenolidase
VHKLLLSIAFLAPVLAVPLNAADEKTALSKSPRHHEWVDVKSGARSVRAFVAYPESKQKATAVVVIHENKGLTDWVRSVADQLAAAGYLAIAPDLLSGTGPGGGNTDAFATVDDATKAIGQLKPEQVTADLNAIADHVLKLPAANGKLAVGGFCWGGAQTFRFATDRKDLKAAFVFYGSAPESKEALARIQAPVYGFYGGEDARITAAVPQVEAAMKELGKKYEPVTYDGATHGFMRKAEVEPQAPEADKNAATAAWERWKKLLAAL